MRLGGPDVEQIGECVVGPDVAVQNEEGSGKQAGERFLDAAAGLEQFGLPAVVDADAEVRPVAEPILDGCAEVVQVDDHVADAGAVQPANLMHDQRLAAHRDEWLGDALRQRPQPLAASGREDHGAHGKSSSRLAAQGTRSLPIHVANSRVSGNFRPRRAMRSSTGTMSPKWLARPRSR